MANRGTRAAAGQKGGAFRGVPSRTPGDTFGEVDKAYACTHRSSFPPDPPRNSGARPCGNEEIDVTLLVCLAATVHRRNGFGEHILP